MFMEKRGYLYKQGGKHKSWHLRYFVLQPGMFTYYKNDPVSDTCTAQTVFGIHCLFLFIISNVFSGDRKEKFLEKLNYPNAQRFICPKQVSIIVTHCLLLCVRLLNIKQLLGLFVKITSC